MRLLMAELVRFATRRPVLVVLLAAAVLEYTRTDLDGR